jgi:hypothetical protein
MCKDLDHITNAGTVGEMFSATPSDALRNAASRYIQEG